MSLTTYNKVPCASEHGQLEKQTEGSDVKRTLWRAVNFSVCKFQDILHQDIPRFRDGYDVVRDVLDLKLRVEVRHPI